MDKTKLKFMSWVGGILLFLGFVSAITSGTSNYGSPEMIVSLFLTLLFGVPGLILMTVAERKLKEKYWWIPLLAFIVAVVIGIAL